MGLMKVGGEEEVGEEVEEVVEEEGEEVGEGSPMIILLGM